MADPFADYIKGARDALHSEELAMKLDRIGNTPDAAENYLKAAATLNEAAAMCTISKASVAAADCAKAAETFAASVFPDSASKAAKLYRQAAKQFSAAAARCPGDCNDREAIEAHVSEIEVRAVYLESLNGAPTSIPIEHHIGKMTLQLDPKILSCLSSEQASQESASSAAGVVLSVGSAVPTDLRPAAEVDHASASTKIVEPADTQSVTGVDQVATEPATLRVDFLQNAVDLERKAQALDAAGQLQQALEKYTQCLQLYAFVQKKEQNLRVKQMVRDRMAAILDCAEVLKAKVLLG